MKAVILAVRLLLPLSFSIASAQLTKVTVDTARSPQANFPPGWRKKPGFLAKIIWMCSSFISEEEPRR
jgi:hypothetical protein